LIRSYPERETRNVDIAFFFGVEESAFTQVKHRNYIILSSSQRKFAGP
jgi:hypothetical protein